MLFSASNRKGGTLLFLFSILSSLLLFSSQSGTALGAPVSDFGGFEILDARDNHIPNKEEVEKLIQDGSDFSKYAKGGKPKKDEATFFTGQDRKTITKLREWAHSQGLTTVRDIWKSDNFFQQKQYKNVDDATFRKFQEAFSKYYAELTEGKAYLIFPHDQKPKTTGVFWSIELEEIINKGQVDEIIWLDQNKMDDKDYKKNDETTVYWKKGDKKPDGA